MPSSANRVLHSRTAWVAATLPLLVAAASACRTTPPGTEVASVIVPACRVSEPVVRGLGVGSDGVGRFAVTFTGCPAARDSLGVAVIDRLLFTGVPEAGQSLPMLERPEEMRKQASPALRELQQRAWTQFVTRLDPPSTEGDEVWIDLTALRRWLERNNLSRKFGMP